MNLLYIVAESEADADFYALCASRITGQEFEKISLRNRKGDGFHAVQRQMKNAVKMACGAAGGENQMFFIGSIDNDRSPHPENSDSLNRELLVPEERIRSSRLDWMLATIEEVLSANRATWPLSVALAIPVEMIESWIIRSRREAPFQPTPHFSKADSHRARVYYAPTAPCSQWKDLAAEEQASCGHADKFGFYEQIVREMEPATLASRSPSFRIFKEWLDTWPKA